MAYNPADYEARRRGYTQQYAATGAMNAYANFLARQRGTRERQGIMEQYDRTQPQVVMIWARLNVLKHLEISWQIWNQKKHKLLLTLHVSFMHAEQEQYNGTCIRTQY